MRWVRGVISRRIDEIVEVPDDCEYLSDFIFQFRLLERIWREIWH